MNINQEYKYKNINQEFSQSSFIPFCSFGDEIIGSEIDGFDMKVCNIFKPKLYLDQLCYETDLQELKDNHSVILRNQLKLGLTLVLDYNEERQINSHYSENGSISKKKFSYNLNSANSLTTHLDTISMMQEHKMSYSLFLSFCMNFIFKRG